VLPDGIFSDQNLQFGLILEGLSMEEVGLFKAIINVYGHSAYFAVIL
jgi:hypothetical protein